MSCKGPARRTMRDDVCYALPCSSEIGGDEGNKIKPQTRQILHCCVVPLIWLLYNDDNEHNDKPPTEPVQCCAKEKAELAAYTRSTNTEKKKRISRSNPESKRSLSLNTKEVTKENLIEHILCTNDLLGGWKKVL